MTQQRVCRDRARAIAPLRADLHAPIARLQRRGAIRARPARATTANPIRFAIVEATVTHDTFVSTRTVMIQCVLALASAACDPNQSGNLGSTKLGDMSHPAQRGSPVDDLRAACGAVGFDSGDGNVHRRPYLQQVTPMSAMIGFSDEVIHFVQVEVGIDELVLHAIDGNGNDFDSLVVPVR